MFKKRKLAAVSMVYWFLLFYIIAALVWWFIALNRQAHQMAVYQLEELRAADPAFLQKSAAITAEEKRRNAQFIGEGGIFLLVILIGALFVYRAVRRQIRLTQQQQNFMMAITHELKTPIAVAKLNLETLQKHKLDEQRQHKLINATLQEANRLNTLTSNILVSSQLEGSGYRLNKEELDLSLLIDTALQDFRNRFPDTVLDTAIEPGIDLQGDAFLLPILINNLLDNAAKYSPAGASIRCSLQQQGKAIMLTVADQGIGIANEEKNRIFDRFYRIGNEQVRKTKGTGLG